MKADIKYINKKLLGYGEKTYTLKELEFPEIKTDGKYLVDDEGKKIGTKGDYYAKMLMEDILANGTFDEEPRPKYESDGKPAYTISLNNKQIKYNLSKGESPMQTLRPIAVKKSIGEALWIYQDASTDLDLLRDKYGITWWDEWDLKDHNGNPLRSIGSVYGNTVADYNQMRNLIKGLIEDPDSRRHIIDLWQLEEFKKPHGLKPCAYQTTWNVRHGKDDNDYLDMKLVQRSSDFMVAGCINQMQYVALLEMVAQVTGYTPGEFTWDVGNIQIYNRHILQAIEELRRTPINCIDEKHTEPYLDLNKAIDDFYDFTLEDVKVKNYPREKILKLNPQLKFDKGI